MVLVVPSNSWAIGCICHRDEFWTPALRSEILIHYEKGVPPTSEELAKKLESKKETVQAEALEELILLMINGESYPKLLMTIIRFVVTSRDHRVKKLLQIYWEIVEKTKDAVYGCRELDTGDLKEEMILVCNALRNDLMHANEYVCGSTLRLLCKMKYYRILEPLKEAVLRNLSHRHSYVRRNAVMCVFSIVKSFGVEVLPEAPEDIEQLLLVEGDLSTKRNAFLMLVNCDQERAIKYVLSLQEQVSSMGDIFQLAVLELVRKVCRSTSVNKGRFLRIVFDLAASSSTAVSYECASSLVTLSSSPVAIHQAAQAYVQLLTEQSDNNVKLIVLDRLRDVQKHHKQVMEGMVMDIFRALSCPSLDVRKKAQLTQMLKTLDGSCKARTVSEVMQEVRGFFTLGHLLYAYAYLRMLHYKDPNLYYASLWSDPAFLLPIVYTPTVGEACQKFGMLPFFPRGCYVSISDCGKIKQVLQEYAECMLPKDSEGRYECQCIVFSDAGRILGLGDLGCWGMGIPIGKLDLYTVCAGFNPYKTVPVIIDAGCSDETGNSAKLKIRDHDLYTGLKQDRMKHEGPSGAMVNTAYYGPCSLIGEFMQAASELFSRKCLLQFEDFNTNDAFPLLQEYRHKFLSYNDDIQGTAAVVVAAILGGIRIQKPGCKELIKELRKKKVLFYGAGSANLGSAMLLRDEAGVPAQSILCTNSKGVIWKSEKGTKGNFKNFEQKEVAAIGEPTGYDHTDLIAILKHHKPDVLIGAVGRAPGCFNQAVVETMVQIQREKPGGGGRPIIFALSNPMSQAEITAEDCYKFSEGEAIFGSGTRFPPVNFKGRKRVPGQVNNFFIFPGMSFGAYWCEAEKIPDKWFMIAAATVAQSLDEKDMEVESVLPHPARIQQVSHNVSVKVAMTAHREGLAGRPLGEDTASVSTALKADIPNGALSGASPSRDLSEVVDICLGSLVSPRNIKDIVALLKKEVIKTLGYEASNTEGNLEYRRLLIRALHACTGQYPDQAQSVMFLLMDFLTESDQTTATEVVMFLRELIANYSEMRLPILQRLAECIGDVSQSRVLRGCLWLFGEYCEDEALIESVIQAVLTSLRPLPLVTEDGSQKEKKEGAGGEKKKETDVTPVTRLRQEQSVYVEKKAPKITTKTVVLADGTYGHLVFRVGEEEEVAEEKGKADVKKTAFRTLLLGFIDKALYEAEEPAGGLAKRGGEKCDSAVRLSQCIRAFAVLGKSQLPPAQLAAAQLVQGDWSGSQGRAQLAKVLELASQNSEWALGQEEEVQEKSVAPDECIVFRQLRERKGGAGPTGGMDDDEDFHAARGATIAQAAADGALFAERLAKVQQMTGLADPVYVEAFLQVHSFDLMLELLVVNRTNETLQNVLVELSTQGDLKLVDRPSAVTLSAGQQMTLHASIKVASTETGIIFGYVTFEKKSAADKECSARFSALDTLYHYKEGAVVKCAVLNELHVDILDYIERRLAVGSWINELAFRTMWSEFEWENKVNINTSITEDALANISIEKLPDGKLTGGTASRWNDGVLIPKSRSRSFFWAVVHWGRKEDSIKKKSQAKQNT
ncbi:Coatomer subunit beta (Beta-coat protein) (Beta-COP) [Durusdinium trenchii]|uniref:Coatomer subunit beta (Beta-coat protein) (Beta-COP) n=1 Tax=Durusdinium trenchii TaxID=1381693 RepID=A0ABP0MPV0_9DINO